MFTGLITHVGTIDRVASTAAGRELRVVSDIGILRAGESVALNGTCLTVRENGSGWFTVAAAAPTMTRTTIGDWDVGRRVNLERALRLGDALGGHLVQGHVDGVGEVTRVENATDALVVTVELSEALMPLVAPQGSICLDGVSLTVSALSGVRAFQVAVIEYTRRHTTLAVVTPGQNINVEVDVIARHVHRLLSVWGGALQLPAVE